jgi:hypothetical protein
MTNTATEYHELTSCGCISCTLAEDKDMNDKPQVCPVCGVVASTPHMDDWDR